MDSRHIGFPGIRVTSACEPLVMSAGTKFRFSVEQTALSAAESSLQPHVIFFYYNLKSKCF